MADLATGKIGRARGAMNVLGASFLLTCALTVASISGALAQTAAPVAPAAGSSSRPAKFDLLKGEWVRPDGGYTIAIRSVGSDGKLDALYFNPHQLPLAKARVSRDGETLRVSLELQAGGYAGSTYELTYDPASDRLKGVYYQAVAKQKFDVYFARKTAP